MTAPAAVPRRIIAVFPVLQTITVRFDCLHEVTNFDPPKGWPTAEHALDATFGCTQCPS